MEYSPASGECLGWNAESMW